MQSDQIAELAAALAKAQGAMQNAPMNRINPHFRSRYADLASILDASRKPLSDNGLAVLQATEFNGTGAKLRTSIVHTSGQWVSCEWPLPTSGKPQEMGSALTYARRYSLASLIGIAAEEDDDANAAEKAAQKPVNNGAPVLIEELGAIQSAMVKGGVPIDWLLEFLRKRGLQIERLEDIPRTHYEKVLTAIASKAAKHDRPSTTDSGN